jgi:hypothetical protein
VAEAVRVICENGKEITWDDILAFRRFRTATEAREHVKRRSLDVFSYYKNDLLCVTLLSKLMDFCHLQRSVILPMIKQLLDDAKEKGVLEKCAKSPSWVSIESSVVYKPIAVLMSAGELAQFIPYLVLLHAFDDWCAYIRDTQRTVFQWDRVAFLYEYVTVLLDCIRPPMFALNANKHKTIVFRKATNQYAAAGDACRSMAWCCGKENAGGVWYDLWVCVAERWDYRTDSWVDAEVSEKRLKN